MGRSQSHNRTQMILLICKERKRIKILLRSSSGERHPKQKVLTKTRKKSKILSGLPRIHLKVNNQRNLLTEQALSQKETNKLISRMDSRPLTTQIDQKSSKTKTYLLRLAQIDDPKTLPADKCAMKLFQLEISKTPAWENPYIKSSTTPQILPEKTIRFPIKMRSYQLGDRKKRCIVMLRFHQGNMGRSRYKINSSLKGGRRTQTIAWMNQTFITQWARERSVTQKPIWIPGEKSWMRRGPV